MNGVNTNQIIGAFHVIVNII